MRGQCRGSAQAKKRCVHAHSHPTLCHGVPRIFLTAPLSYDAVALHLGQREKLLRYVKLATSSGESMKKLARAVSCGNNQAFLYGEKVEQEMAEGCQRLMKNAIICWNSLYLTQKIAEADSEERRQELLLAVRNGSVGTWHHINLHGEYDFSDEKLQDSIGLHASTILAENVLGQWEDGVPLVR